MTLIIGLLFNRSVNVVNAYFIFIENVLNVDKLKHNDGRGPRTSPNASPTKRRSGPTTIAMPKKNQED